MANKMDQATRIMLQNLAAEDYDYRKIASFLDKIHHNQGIEVDIFDSEQGKIVRVNLTPEEGWEFIKLWVENTDHNHNFSLSRRGSRRAQIEALLSDVRAKLSLRDQAASASSTLRHKARQEPPQTNSPLSSSYQKAHAVWAAQIDALQKRLFDPLYLVYYNSPLLAHIQNDTLRKQAAFVLAGDPTLASEFNGVSADIAANNLVKQTMRIHYLLSRAVPQLYPLTQEIYSDQLQVDAAITLSRAKEELVARYPGKVPGSINYRLLNEDLNQQAILVSSSITLTSFENNLAHLSIISQEHQQVITDHIRKIIVAAADGPHLSGQQIIEHLSKQKFFDQATIDSLLRSYPSLYDDIELLEIKTRSEIVKVSVADRKRKRELYTQGLAETLGLNPSTFWLREKDLNNVVDHLLQQYDIKIDSNKTGLGLLEDKLLGLRDALKKSVSGDLIDLTKYNELLDVTDRTTQYLRYQRARANSPLLIIQDGLSKLNYHLNVIREPYDFASRKYWSAIDNIDNIIHYPSHKIADWWFRLVDGEIKIFGRDLTGITITKKDGSKFRIPLLDLPSFASTHLLLLQKQFAVHIFAWSYKLTKRGGLYAAIFKPISNYSFIFVQVDGWREANYAFGGKVIGNFLNWGARRLGFKSFTAMKTAAGQAIFKVANKVTFGLLGKATAKITAYLASLGLDIGTAGVGTILTVAMLAWDLLIKPVIAFFKKIFTDPEFLERLLNRIPLIIGGAITGISAIFLAIPGALANTFVGLFGFLGGALSGLVGLFTSSILWGGGIVVGVMLIFNIFKVTTKIDPGLGLFQAIYCSKNDETGVNAANNTTVPRNKVAECATCLVEYLTKCYQNPITGSKLSGQGLGCLLAQAVAPDVAAAIQNSAVYYNNLQCVGFARAAAICGGGDLEGRAVASDYIRNPASGYTLVDAKNCSPGDLGLIDGLVGHIFVVGSNNGATITGIDANFTCTGCVSSNTPFPTSRVAGCMKRI